MTAILPRRRHVAAPAPASPWRAWARTLILLGIPLVLAAWHVWDVSKRYAVGSFDDDSSYILTAKALLDGAGFTGHLVSGASVIGAYPPGYSFLLVPLFWIWPHGYNPERIAAASLFLATFPLLWVYLGRRKVSEVVRFVALLALAMSPVAATFASMVMAETVFLVLLMVVLLAVEGWDQGARVWSRRGVAIVVGAAGLVWLKEAGLGVVVGLGLWYLLRHQWRKAVAVVGGCAVLLSPVLIGRAVSGVPLSGARYSQELGSFYSGGMIGRLFHVAPVALFDYFRFALPKTIIPTGSPLPQTGAWADFFQVVTMQVGIFTVLGFVLMVRRHADAAVVAIPVYVAESLLWPEINERRVILVLPILVGWYAYGTVTAVRWAVRFGKAGAAELTIRSVGVAFLAVVTVAYPLRAQFHRDYLYGLKSSQPMGSRYMALLSMLGTPPVVVETDYESTTALLSGHRTANTAFIDATSTVCDLGVTQKALATDDAGFMLLATLNKPEIIDDACLMSQATSTLSAVRLLRTNRDQASVFQLIGPGTAYPDLVDRVPTATFIGSGATWSPDDLPLARGDYPGTSTAVDPVDGTATLSWYWATATPLTQASVGEVKAYGGGQVTGATLQVLDPSAGWRTVASAAGVVGDNGAEYLLGQLPAGTRANGMRLVIAANEPVVVTDIHALGSSRGQG